MRKPTDRFGHDLRTVFPLNSMVHDADAAEAWMAAVKRRDRRRHRFDWIVIVIVWILTGTAIYGQLTGKIRFGITAAMLVAATGLIVGITPSIFSRRR
jgi:hypothetical protein